MGKVPSREERRDGLFSLAGQLVLEEPLDELPDLVEAPLGHLRQDDHLVRHGLDGLPMGEGDEK